MKTYICHFDGGCYPNPGGPIGIGYVVTFPNACDTFISGLPAYPTNSNNVAEYLALTALLNHFKSSDAPCRLIIKGDSLMVIKQMNKKMKIGSGHYVPYALKAIEIASKLTDLGVIIEYHWIPREQNDHADQLSQQGRMKYL